MKAFKLQQIKYELYKKALLPKNSKFYRKGKEMSNSQWYVEVTFISISIFLFTIYLSFFYGYDIIIYLYFF